VNVSCTRLLGMLVLAIFVSACDKADTGKPAVPQNNTQWSQFINAHTRGTISKNDSISIRFVNDIVDEDKVGTDAVGVLEVSPPINGELIFNTRREILLVPQEKLTSGQTYRFTLHPHALKDIPSSLDKYVFDVNVIRQSFEVQVRGVTAQLDAINKVQIVGAVNTADSEEADRIEKVLAARFNGQPIGINWQHAPNGRAHEFIIPGIERSTDKQDVVLGWNGEGIGVDKKDEQVIAIPAKGDFKVSHVRVVQADRQYIEIQTTDALDTAQNLNGLIQFTQGEFTTQIDGSVIKVFPASSITGEATVTLDAAIRSQGGNRLGERLARSVVFTSQKPQVRFAGKGVILPQNQVLAIPFETINVHSVQVTAMLIYENNIGQFLQDNQLNTEYNIQRVGRYLWRKTIKLTSPQPDKWNRYTLDATDLLQSHPGALFQLTLSINRSNSTYSCSEADNAVPFEKDQPLLNYESPNLREASNWDYYEEYYNTNYYQDWENRENPCKDAYYRFEQATRAKRNFMASNLGLLAKRGEGNRVHVVVTDLTSAEPVSGAEIELRNFQNQMLARLTSNNEGFAETDLTSQPFYLIARKDRQVGYLKLSAGNALATSHFDVGGQAVRQGVKGLIYGERGVWRPGDDIHVVFVLEDKQNTIPENHPVTMEFYNPKGVLLETVTNSKPVGDFYRFKFATAEKAETGNYKVRAILGNNQFNKTIKVETVVPNHLKIDLQFPAEQLYVQDMPFKLGLSSQWLHGAIASGLRSDVAVTLSPTKTSFGRFTDFNFDDPARVFHADKQTVFEGELNDRGEANFSADLRTSTPSPGMLKAYFATRVFEQGGAFSTHSTSVTYHPYQNYVGIQIPKGDAARNMLLTDKKQTVSIASLNNRGEPVSLDQIQIALYKVDWKWWWDQSGDNLAQYANAYYNQQLAQATIQTKDGRGSWEFEVKYPDWGRYMIRACDVKGNHCTGQVFYIDWPAWAGRDREQRGAGANVLSFSADKPEYKVGETATIKLPEATQGRALLTVENGSRILSQRWLQVSKQNTEFSLPVTADMSPNVYVSVSLIQPHAQKDNDRPIRLYGVIPLIVEDPNTRLHPELSLADEWRPESQVEIGVKETSGHTMNYTIAVVDEGLLGLTNFRTPDLHAYFYQKEALGVRTWDLFDEVAGAYGGELERLLALGGDADAGEDDKDRKKRRFPPVVRFIGPFHLDKGQSQVHKIDIPQYLGSVRVMLVAGQDGAYGLADKSVFVRQPLGLLATLPRVIGPEETLSVPVSVFVMDDRIRHVKLKLETDDHFVIDGSDVTELRFKGQGEQIGFINVKVADKLGQGVFRFTATSGEHVAKSEIYIDVRSANPKTTKYVSKTLSPGESWSELIKPHGIGGTNTVTLEMSSIPPINLENRLQYLIRYPHGCLEQTTSAIFPQIFLGQVMKLNQQQKDRIQKHVEVALIKLQHFQQMNGGFSYWPGNNYYNSWSNSYAGHFLVEAEKQGYYVSPQMLSNWINYQKSVASSWYGGDTVSELDQAYRLYTLAVAQRPELGAMNRMRETNRLDNTARWLLAAAYQLTGLGDVASELIRGADYHVSEYRHAGSTLGSPLRDKALILQSLSLMKRYDEAKPIADDIARELSADRWYSTQSLAFSLIGMGQFVGNGVTTAPMTFTRTIGEGEAVNVGTNTPIHLQTLEKFSDSGEKLTLVNTTDRMLYATVTLSGIPRAGEEGSSRSGIGLDIDYTDAEGHRVDITRLRQGSDIIAHIKVRNHSDFTLENLALSHIVPSGWQIHNPRMSAGENDQLPAIDYQDIRDDRVYTYFSLNRGETKTFKTQINASFLGHYYLPGIHVEAMYDATKHARSKGKWVDVVK